MEIRGLYLASRHLTQKVVLELIMSIISWPDRKGRSRILTSHYFVFGGCVFVFYFNVVLMWLGLSGYFRMIHKIWTSCLPKGHSIFWYWVVPLFLKRDVAWVTALVFWSNTIAMNILGEMEGPVLLWPPTPANVILLGVHSNFIIFTDSSVHWTWLLSSPLLFWRTRIDRVQRWLALDLTDRKHWGGG